MTVCGPVAAPAGIVMVLVTWVWLTWMFPEPAMVPTVTLLTGAFAGGGAGTVAGSMLMVSVKVAPRAPLVGDTLAMPVPPPVVVPETGS